LGFPSNIIIFQSFFVISIFTFLISDDDYYVCDFKGHSIVVFNDEGVCLRRIGGEYITSFPNGIDISENGEILVGDSHGNRFHVAVFSHDGTHLTDLECPYIKVSIFNTDLY